VTKTFSFVRRYAWFAGKMVGKKEDRLGTVQSGSRFYPYGEEWPATGQDDTKFATYWRDGSTNLDYAMNRYYQSTLGRFLSPDPFRGSASKARSGSWNRYAYVEGDPVGKNDPSGLYTDGCLYGCLMAPPDAVTGSGGGIIWRPTGLPSPDEMSDAERQDAAGILGNFLVDAALDSAYMVSTQIHYGPGVSESSFSIGQFQNNFSNLINMVQGGLDILGLVPGIGDVADFTNGVIYAAQGQGTDAALSFAAMLPVGGQAATAARIGRRFTPDQSALIDLVRDYERKGGVPSADVSTIQMWADEYGLPFRFDPPQPTGRVNFPHLHVGPLNHIEVVP